jgi:DNA-binding transcriptional LysR family regulator
MARFDLDLLNTFAVIAETGSFSAAAPRLCRSQSAISEQMRKLEQTCGLTLLLRGKTGATLTPAGERLLSHARDLLALSDMAYRDMQGVQLAGELRLAITDYFRPASVTAVLKRLRALYPRLRLHVCVRESAFIERNADNFDIGVAMRILDSSSQRAEADFDDGLQLRQEALSWIADEAFESDGSALPLVVLQDSCSLRSLIVRSLDRQGIAYEIAHSASGVAGLQLATAAGLGVTCLNASAIPPQMVHVGEKLGLPAMPNVAFGLMAPRKGEAMMVTQVRRMLAQQLASG